MEDFWREKKVFITGANGFLGSHLTKKLIDSGNRPFVLVYEQNPGSIFDQEKLGEKSRVIEGDVRDFQLIEKILKENKIDSVFHLAAQAIVDQAAKNPIQTFETNVRGTWNILEAAAKTPSIERVVVASSDKAYGHHDNLPYREDTHHLNGFYPYEVSKTCADLISQSYWRTFNLPVAITRCTNIYGPGDLKYNRLVPRTMQNLFQNKPPIIRDTGESLRDYIYIEDAIDGYLKLAEKMNKDIFGHAFNFAMNQPLSVTEVIQIISEELGKNIEPTIIKTAGFDIKHQYASYAKAKELLGWEPRHAFREGIRKTKGWYYDQLIGKK